MIQPSAEPSDQSAVPESQPAGVETAPRLTFPVVAIGGSAGGFEAFSEFFEAMPPDSGMAFVVVQHLPPELESMMAELFSERTLE